MAWNFENEKKIKINVSEKSNITNDQSKEDVFFSTDFRLLKSMFITMHLILDPVKNKDSLIHAKGA